MDIDNRLKSMTKKGLVTLSLRLGIERPSKIGKDDLIAHLLEKIPEEILIESLTPLEKKKRKLSIGLIGAYASIIGFIFSVLFFYISKEGDKTVDKKIGNVEKKLENFKSLNSDQIIKEKDTEIEEKEREITELKAKLGDELFINNISPFYFQLSSLPDNSDYPYRLTLKNAKTGEKRRVGPLLEGEIYGLVLEADEKKLRSIRKIDRRYIYVFSIDSNEKVTLLFPSIESIKGFRNLITDSDEIKTEIQLGNRELFIISAPFGADRFILLTTQKPIPDLGIIFSGAQKWEDKSISQSLLARIFYNIGILKKGDNFRPQPHWSIENLPIVSEGKKGDIPE